MPGTETDHAPAQRGTAPGAPEIFVSPRVVDQAAFSEFASALRELVDRAGGQVEPLKSTTAAAERTLAAIRDSAGRQQARLDLALKTLAALEERSQHVERSLERATHLSTAVARLSDEADHVMSTKLSEFATQVQSESQRAAARIALLESRLERAEGDLERKVAEVVSRLGLGRENDAARPVDLPGLVARGEAVCVRADAAAAELDGVRRSAEEAGRILGASVEHAAARAEELRGEHERLSGSVQSSVELCREADTALRTRAEALREATETPMQELRLRAEEAAEALRMTVEQSERACELGYQVLSRQVESVTELRRLLAQLEPWRGLVGGEAGSELPRPLVEVVETVRARVAAELGGLTAALASLAQGAEAATRAIGAGERRGAE